MNTLYQTGDRARWLPDGNIQFLGRVDSQVKLRGYRIEPGEIERVLQTRQEIREAVVTAKEDSHNDRYLCAYVVASREINRTRLKTFLSGHLPYYMVPSHIIPLEKIPLNSHGKIDRSALPEPGAQPAENWVPPRDELEKILVEVWQKVLDKTKIGIKDNFFQMGGHSLMAVKLARAAEKQLDQTVKVRMIFQAPTIEELALLIKRENSSTPENQYQGMKPAQFLEKVKDQLHIKQLTLRKHRYCIWFGDLDEEQIRTLIDSGCPPQLLPHYIRPLNQMNQIPQLQQKYQKHQVQKPSTPGTDAEHLQLTESQLAQLLQLETEPASYPELKKTYCRKIRLTYKTLNDRLKENMPSLTYNCGYQPGWYASHYGKYKVIHIMTALFDGHLGIDEETILEGINLFIQKQGLLRSVLIEKKIDKTESLYYFQEYPSLELSDLPVIDLSGFSPRLHPGLIADVIRSLAMEIFSSSTIFDRLLFNPALIKLNRLQYKLAFCFSHAISDHFSLNLVREHFEVLNRYPPHQPVSFPDNRVENFRTYVKLSNYRDKVEFDKFKKSSPYIRYRETVEKIQGRYPPKKPILFSDPCHLQLWPTGNESKANDEPLDFFGIGLAAAVRVIAALFNLREVPLRVLFNRRVIGDTYFYNTLGDFHVSIPVLFPPGNPDPGFYVQTLQALDDSMIRQGYNISQLGKDQEIKRIVFAGPFNFDFVGEVSQEEEEVTLMNADYFKFVPYPVYAYQRGEKLGMIFFHGITNSLAKKMPSLLEPYSPSYDFEYLNREYHSRYFRKTAYQMKKLRIKLLTTFKKLLPFSRLD